jgi:RimJ/RimL family protein N-acetyltransferase
MTDVLNTSRLRLRELEAGDIDFVAAMLAEPDVMRYWPRPQTRTEAEDWIRRHQERYRRDGHGYWLALDAATGEPVGQAGVLTQEIDGVAERGLGYILHRPFWGRGLALEAARGCLAWARRERGYTRVICTVRPENVASLRVAVRLGFLPEKLTMYAGFAHLVFADGRTPAGERGAARLSSGMGRIGGQA